MIHLSWKQKLVSYQKLVKARAGRMPHVPQNVTLDDVRDRILRITFSHRVTVCQTIKQVRKHLAAMAAAGHITPTAYNTELAPTLVLDRDLHWFFMTHAHQKPRVLLVFTGEQRKSALKRIEVAVVAGEDALNRENLVDMGTVWRA